LKIHYQKIEWKIKTLFAIENGRIIPKIYLRIQSCFQYSSTSLFGKKNLIKIEIQILRSLKKKEKGPEALLLFAQ